MKKNWKKHSLWVSVISLIGLILQTYGLYEVLGLTNDTFQGIANGILVVLVGAGIITSPDKNNEN